MKSIRTLVIALMFVAVFFAGSTARAADCCRAPERSANAASGELVAPTGTDDAWLAKAREAYPLKVCLVSDEELGGAMGESVDRIYREKGQPDRLVRFCCKSCIRDFKKDPAKFLGRIDQPVESQTPDHSKSHH